MHSTGNHRSPQRRGTVGRFPTEVFARPDTREFVLPDLRVFRLPPGKKSPPPRRFWEVATSDPAEVRKMRTDPVTGASLDINLGVCTRDGLVALDIDVNGGGLASLRQLVAEYKLLDQGDTYCVRTASGGLHIYLATPKDIQITNAVDWRSGIDVRGTHGYLVGEGSTIGGKPYTRTTLRDYLADPHTDAPQTPYELAQILPINAELLSQLRRRKEPASAVLPAAELDTPANVAHAITWLKNEALCAIQGQGGDHSTFVVACGLRNRLISEPKARDLMLAH